MNLKERDWDVFASHIRVMEIFLKKLREELSVKACAETQNINSGENQ